MKKLFCLLLGFSLLGCMGRVPQSNNHSGEWRYSELRIIDPSDVSEPNLDMIGFYFRDLGKVLEFRLDFLDLDPAAPVGFMIAYNHGYPGHPQLSKDFRSTDVWNQLLIILPDGRAFLKNEGNQLANELRISITRDTTLDAVILKVNKAVFKDYSIKTRVTIYSFGDEFLQLDELGPVLLNRLPPEPLEVTIAFWNTFQSKTPAQTLRAWDGAHTGPFSMRHGLKALLDAVEETDVPVYLLDLESKPNRSALDYLNVLPRIQRLEDEGLLQLTRLDSSIFSSPQYEMISIETQNPISEVYPSVETRKNIVNTFKNQEGILVLGGNFSNSAWGNYETASQMLAYIKNHPWLKTVAVPSLQVQQTQPMVNENEILLSIFERLRTLPNNRITQMTRELLTTFIEEGNPKEKVLQSQYLGQIGHLLAIIEWSKNPREITDCEFDLDWDQLPECLLATERTVAVIEAKGGYISFAFTLNSGEFHQIIGPTFQLITGLSDPSAWDFSQGLGADPMMIPGAFVTYKNKWLNYSPIQLSPGMIVLQNMETGGQKIFSALVDGFLFHYNGIDSDQFLIPILLDPWTMDVQGWGYMYDNEFNSNHWNWSLKDRITINYQSSEPIEVQTFKDSYNYMGVPEQPSFAYPDGHFLPFPLALGLIHADGEGMVQISISYSAASYYNR